MFFQGACHRRKVFYFQFLLERDLVFKSKAGASVGAEATKVPKKVRSSLCCTFRYRPIDAGACGIGCRKLVHESMRPGVVFSLKASICAAHTAPFLTRLGCFRSANRPNPPRGGEEGMNHRTPGWSSFTVLVSPVP
jgi:hypothetical protein